MHLKYVTAIMAFAAIAPPCAIQAEVMKGPFVFTAETMRQQTETDAADANGDFWTPTLDDASRAIESTRTYLIEHAREFGYKPPRSHDRTYTHQIFGVTNDGARNIVVLGVCRKAARELSPTIANELVSVVDGGACFFRSEVSLETMKVVDFRFNPIGG